MNHQLFRTVVTAVILSLASLFQAVAEEQSEEDLQQAKLKANVDYLNELSSRRRVNTLFKNIQSPKYGLQSGFVNVGKGNLTFVRKDLVLPDTLSLVIARVYDSSNEKGGDFGQGWQLSIAETIQVNNDGSLSYKDDRAVTTSLIPSGSGYIPQDKYLTDIQQATIENGSTLILSYTNGWQKSFSFIDDVYRLTQVTDNNGNTLTITYQGHYITSISGETGNQITIERNEDGFIRTVTGNNNQAVNYFYKNGQLTTVNDLGGKVWQYQYNGKKLLTRIIDPRNIKAAKFQYDSSQRVKSASIRASKLKFRYKDNVTLVQDEQKYETLFRQNGDGITTSIINPQGTESRIALNDNHQITQLKQNGITIADYQYHANGLIDKIIRFNSQGDLSGTFHFNEHQQLTSIEGELAASYHYDANGNILSANEVDSVRAYTYYNNGKLKSSHLDGITTSFTYFDNGLLKTASQGDNTAQLEYNERHKLKKVIFPNGAFHEYSYNKLGFRLLTNRSDGSKIHYQYDNTGNLNYLGVAEKDEALEVTSYTLSDENQVKTIHWADEEPLDIQYDGKGNVTSISRNGVSINYSYDKLERLTGVSGETEGELSYEYEKDELDIRLQWDGRTAPAYSNDKAPSQTYLSSDSQHYTRLESTAWHFLGWNERLGVLDLPSIDNRFSPDNGVQSTILRRRIRDLFTEDGQQQRDFDKPSNSYFLPTEFASINCHITCYMDHLMIENLEGDLNLIVGEPGLFWAHPIKNGTPCPGDIYEWYENGNQISSNGANTIAHAFQNTGSNSLKVIGRCIGCTILREKTIFVNIIAPPTLTSVDIITPTGMIGYIDKNLNMPQLSFTANTHPSSIPVTSLTFEWSMKINHTQGNKTTSQVKIPTSGTALVNGNNTWTPTWGSILAGGNNIEVSVTVTGAGTTSSTTTGFSIGGENPTTAQINSYVGTSPWFIRKLVHKESTYRQFSPSPGMPLKSADNGFGLMQIDEPNPTDIQLWSWKKNIDGGKSILNSKNSGSNGASTFWNNQVNEYQQWVANGNLNNEPAPYDITYNGITFSYSPSSSQKSYADAIWIKAYNSANTHFISWDNVTQPLNPRWSFNVTNAQGENYVKSVCDQNI